MIDGSSKFGELKEKDSKISSAEEVSTVDTTEAPPPEVNEEQIELGRQEVIRIPGECPNCSAPGETLTAVTDIPHFKEVIIMAFTCSQCGYKNSEVRGGGAVPTLGTEVILRATSEEDLKRLEAFTFSHSDCLVEIY